MTDIEVLLVPETGAAPTQLNIQPTLEVMQSLVGGYIEAIGGTDWSAYLDEEGKIKGKQPNTRATVAAWRLGWRGYKGDVLVGPVVFTGPVDVNGNDTSITAQVSAVVMRRD